jgi:hypothetical protein
VDYQRNTDGASKAGSARKADRTWDKDRTSNTSHSMIPVSPLNQLQKPSTVMGVMRLRSEVESAKARWGQHPMAPARFFGLRL